MSVDAQKIDLGPGKKYISLRGKTIVNRDIYPMKHFATLLACGGGRKKKGGKLGQGEAGVPVFL